MSQNAPPTPLLNGTTMVPEARFKEFLKASELAGVNTDRILLENGITDPAKLSLAQFFRVERDIARTLDDLTAQLSERKLTYKSGAFVLDQLQQSRTLAEATEHLASYFNMLHGEHYNQVHRATKTLALRIDDTNFPYTLKSPQMVQFVGECVLITVHCLLDSLSDGQAGKALSRVGLPHIPDQTASQHLQFWSVPIAHDLNAYELVYDIELASMPIQPQDTLDLSSEGMFNRVISYLETCSGHNALYQYKVRTSEMIKSGCNDQRKVAAKLGVSVATLRRRLQDEETSFRQLAEDIRMREASNLLKKGFSVSNVTDQLDYSDIRSFNRAFKRWKGLTPAAYAQKCRQAVTA